MSTIESITLMLALVYSTSLLYWGGKKWGALVSGALLLGATLASFFWPLLLILLGAVLVVTAIGQYQPAFANAEGRPNAVREICQHFFALSMLLQ